MIDTKAESLRALEASGRADTVDAAVLAYILAFPKVTRSAICESTGLRVSTACGAIDRLMKRNLVEEAADKVFLPETKRRVKAYQPKETKHG